MGGTAFARGCRSSCSGAGARLRLRRQRTRRSGVTYPAKLAAAHRAHVALHDRPARRRAAAAAADATAAAATTATTSHWWHG